MRSRVEASGHHPTPVIDRFWFKSVYFKEPGGVLFELATDGPGFAVDEDAAHLGETLVLPPWLEPARPRIEEVLPPLKMHEFVINSGVIIHNRKSRITNHMDFIHVYRPPAERWRSRPAPPARYGW